MPSFKFIHAADLHLDSPLTGLAAKSETYARRIDDASRSAFIRLVQLAIDEACAFVLISGDLFDGQWREYRTGLFLASQMGRLREAGIPVYFILGNHDAENRFVSRLELTDNVTRLSSKSPQTVRLDSRGVAIHGQSFPTRDVTDNLAANYPQPEQGYFNIGMLHTALDGREGHALYAPCTVDQLVNHGYDYWALGHIHEYGRQVGSSRSSDCHVVYSGVLQGRHIRETGAKGAVLVSVEDGVITSVEHMPLDSVRWAAAQVDVSRVQGLDGVIGAVVSQIGIELEAAGDRALATRIILTGPTPLHSELVSGRSDIREQIETAAAGLSGEVWIEKLAIATAAPTINSEDPNIDPAIAGRIRSFVDRRSAEPEFIARAVQVAEEFKTKMPAGAWDEGLRVSMLSEVMASSRRLALALLEKGLE